LSLCGLRTQLLRLLEVLTAKLVRCVETRKRACVSGDTGLIARMASAPRPVLTPCVQVCFVDDESGLCLGCFRTLAEIAAWRRLDEATREAVMADLPGRKGRIAPAKLGT
jgi:predicted Fe-S protein YdhL (DUF1289 family)